MTDLATNSGAGADAPASEVATSQDAGDQSLDLLNQGDGEDGQEPEIETEEVEHEGKKYAVPKALKPALMMHADYTRKTQEVAERGRQIEARDAAVAQQEKTVADNAADFGRIINMNDELSKYDAITPEQWQQLAQQDGPGTQAHMIRFQKLKSDRDNLIGTVRQKIEQRNLATQQETAKRFEEARQIAAREIPGWNGDYANKLAAFAMEKAGATQAEIASGQLSPRTIIKLTNLAYVGSQAVTKQAASDKLAGQENIKPVPQVGSARSAAPGLSDRQNTEQWMKLRDQQLRKKG